MFIKLHLMYYAVTLFLIVLSFCVHQLFFVLLVLFLFFFIAKTSFFEVLAFLLCVSLIYTFIPQRDKEFHEIIEGKVVQCNGNSAIIQCDNQNVKVYHDVQFKYGDKVIMKISELEINEQSNDNAFNEKIYYQSNDLDIKAKCIQIIKKSHSYNFVDFIESRMSSHQVVKSYQRLFLLGIKDELIEDEYQQLLSLSVVHLFALSGMHLYYLKKFISQIFSLVLNKEKSDIVVYLLLFMYLIHIPYSISLRRAFYMMILDVLLKRYFNKLDVYCLVFMAFLLKNPFYIYNYSFIFSFGIYLIVLLTHDMKYQEFYIYLFSLPFIIYMQNKVYLISYLFSLFLGIFVEYFYQIILLSLPFSFMNVILNILIDILEDMIALVSCFDYGLIFAKPTLSFIILFYIVVFIIIMRKQLNLKTSFYHCLLISLIIAGFIHGKYNIYATVTMIDVGQGDCTLIRLPFHQGNILIDTGGNYDYDLATTTLIPYFQSVGISSLDYVYISHDDFDHCGALESLTQNFKVKNIIRDYEEKRIIGDLTIEMLKSDNQYSDSNDCSLVMKLTLYDYTFLFTGDISVSVEEDLYEKYGKIDIDILKVSHHGSKSSSGNTLFKMIQPKIAMIGVKKNNLYKHPSIEVIERLERKGITILRTDEDGMFHLRFYGNNGYILR